MGRISTAMQVFHVLFPILLLLGVPVLSVPLHVHHLGGSLQQVGQTVAAGMATNLQWFQPVGTGVSACNTEAASTSLMPGWPGYQGNTLTPVQVGDQVSICVRRKRFFRGGTFGPWRFLTGTLRQGFRPDFGGGFGGDVGIGVGGDGVDVGVDVRDTPDYEVVDEAESGKIIQKKGWGY